MFQFCLCSPHCSMFRYRFRAEEDDDFVLIAGYYYILLNLKKKRRRFWAQTNESLSRKFD